MEYLFFGGGIIYFVIVALAMLLGGIVYFLVTIGTYGSLVAKDARKRSGDGKYEFEHLD